MRLICSVDSSYYPSEAAMEEFYPRVLFFKAPPPVLELYQEPPIPPILAIIFQSRAPAPPPFPNSFRSSPNGFVGT